MLRYLFDYWAKRKNTIQTEISKLNNELAKAVERLKSKKMPQNNCRQDNLLLEKKSPLVGIKYYQLDAELTF